jgi:shikimate kinase
VRDFSEAIAFGAATIINAIASGKGAAFGLDLWTKARVQLTRDTRKIEGKILSEPHEDPVLIHEAVKAALGYAQQEAEWGVYVETESNIPIAKGLKSSSVAANAIVLATLNALGVEADDFTTINLGVDAAIHANKSITGAFDDACASFFGNIILTDNLARTVLKIATIPEDIEAIILVPHEKAYTHEADISKMKLLARFINVAFQQAFQGNYWDALTLNGILYSAALGFDPEPALEALRAGALAAGLTGTGPAIVAVTPSESTKAVMEAWTSFNGTQIRTKINRQKAHMIQ